MKKIGFQLLPLDARYPWPVAEEVSGIWKGRDFTRWSIRKGREICHLGLWKGPEGRTDEYYGFIKPKKRFYFGNWFLFKRQCISEFLTKYVKGVPFVNRRYTKALPFSWKMVYKRVRGWISKRSLPRIWKFVEYPPGLSLFIKEHISVDGIELL